MAGIIHENRRALSFSQIETVKRKGTTDVLSALAKALKVTLDEVVAREE